MSYPVLAIMRKAASVFLAVFIVMSVIFTTFMVMPDAPRWLMTPQGGGDGLSERIIEEMRLDEPLWIQFTDYLVDTLTGDFRVSISVAKGSDIQSFIWDAAGNTLALLSLGLLGSLVMAISLELLVSRRRAGAGNKVVHATGLLFLSIPAFSLALFVLYLNDSLGIGFPLFGDGSYVGSGEGDRIISLIEHGFLPTVTVILSSFGLAVLMVREGIRTLGSDDRTVAPGLRMIATGLVRLRPLMHFYVAWVMSVVIAVDIVFSYEGLGLVLYRSIINLDYPTLMATLFISWMLVLAAGMMLSLGVHALARSRLSDILKDWGARASTTIPPAYAPSRTGTSWRLWFASVWKDYRSSVTGMGALVILVALLVAGVLSPVLSTVEDPTNLENLEPTVRPDWVNPHEPSLDPSPYSGLLHPLGTDMLGRDVYSMWLYSARDAVLAGLVLVIGSVLIGLVAGLVAVRTTLVTGWPAKLFDFLLTSGARAAVAIPIAAFLAIRMTIWNPRDLGITVPMLLVIFYLWGWLLVFRPVREAAMATTGTIDRDRLITLVIVRTLSVAKFAVPLMLVAYFSIHTMGFSTLYDVTWGTMIYDGFMHSAFISGYWHLIIPPLVGMAAITGAMFVAIDRAESVIQNSTSYPTSRV